VALDVIVVLVVTSLLRDRIPHRLWRGVHWLGYLAWVVSMTHAAGIGTDASTEWGRTAGLACLGAVLGATLLRLVADARAVRDPSLATAEVR
jgi:sulfoxide reductase heme-binding subunit YedZ